MYAVNHVPVIDLASSKTGCCTLINPAEWDKQTFVFDNKRFVRVRSRSIFHIPINMGSVMRRVQAAIEEAGASETDWLMLSHETSAWYTDHYLAVTKEVPGLSNERLSGSFVTKVFEGKYSQAPKWYAQLMDYVKSLGEKPLDSYFFYTTCPKCAKAYGKNYVVGFAKV